jgi:O-methyltransferase involved in polyketide biosynthesis
MGLNRGRVASVDTTTPNVARVWDYWLGGRDNFAADRELAQQLLRIIPLAAQMAQENRQFLMRAVSYVAGQGTRQFVDVGSGLPTAVNTHEIARRVAPDAKVAYIDHDPLVVRHAEALLAKSPGVIALHGDAAEPKAILANPQLGQLIDPTAPVCIMLCGVLHFLDIDAARETTATFIRSAPPGSHFIMSIGTGDTARATDFAAAYRAASLHIFSEAQFASFFDGLEVVPPGLVPAADWTAGQEPPHLEPQEASFLVGVGRKPTADQPSPASSPR